MSHPYLTASGLAAAVALLGAGPAAASTFCVPTYHAACTNNGTNIALGSLETALQANHMDGVKDTVIIAAGVLTDPDTIETHGAGTDDLEIIGAGPGTTTVTSSATGNQFVMNLEPGARKVTVRDLTIRVPASFADDGGSAAQVSRGVFENVDVDSRNEGGDGIAFVGGGAFRDGRLFSSAGGTLATAIRTNGAKNGPLTVERTRIDAPSWGVDADDPAVPVTIRRTSIFSPLAYAVRIATGGAVTMQNSIITSTTSSPITVVSGSAAGATFTGDHLTIVGGPGQTNPAVTTGVTAGMGNGGAQTLISNSIIRGFTATFARSAPASVLMGNALLTISDSNFAPTGTSSGDGTLAIATRNINANPLFAGPDDLRLTAASPSLDAGAPGPGGVADDLVGALRPQDGDGDGISRRDQGAYERPAAPVAPGAVDPNAGQGAGPAPAAETTTTTPTTTTTTTTEPAATPTTQPATTGPGQAPADRVRPRITALRLLRGPTRRRAGAFALRLSERATVVLTFTARRSTARGAAKARTVRLRVVAPAGSSRVTIRAGRLASRRYALTAVATDAAGNRSTTVRRAIIVRR